MHYDDFRFFESFVSMRQKRVELNRHAARQFIGFVRQREAQAPLQHPAKFIIVTMKLRRGEFCAFLRGCMHTAHIAVIDTVEIEIAGLVALRLNAVRSFVFGKRNQIRKRQPENTRYPVKRIHLRRILIALQL